MNDRFFLGVYWKTKPESLLPIVNKTLETMLMLTQIDIEFADWYELGYSKKEALNKKFYINTENIEKKYRKKREKDIDIRGFSDIGFILSLWSGYDGNDSSNISFNVGANSKYLSNSCTLDIPNGKIFQERLLHLDKSKKLILNYVKIWSPDYAVLTSDYFREHIDSDIETGWLTYKKSIKIMPNLSKNIICEQIEDGYLFRLSNLHEKCYDYTLLGDFENIKKIK